MTCDHCQQPAIELIGMNVSLCPACYEKAKRELYEDRAVKYCFACGAGLYRIDHGFEWSGLLEFDCPDCGRDYLQRPGEAIQRWHENQPQCSCGHHAAYVGAMVRPGSPSPGDVTVWDCTRCGKRLQSSKYAGQLQVREMAT